MESSDLRHFLTAACAAAAVGTGPLTPENEQRAQRVAHAYFDLHQGNHAGLNLVTQEISQLKAKDPARNPEASQALHVITETLHYCKAVLPPADFGHDAA
ncbi:MAG TPA: hypothetical protein DEB30_02990 [Candidatus Peribacter riflensis]|uniref:Uncharacterized protein n=1 Tax=Candidatus Peribacter riflensis TaxID=1735162 RepID=A0A0S1SP10_9BACT|nr:MAG: hypothetical protein PeribacterA2_0610 [Candidatus Peribacter riflensis]OGJ79089.1 MAG: hypothetical protein A2398_00155 [Candidatus Peribacteria bacterium RIFOXYB1_FULL_57_12]OGJ80649.1 MAG: hypothetical protein A2412_03975 [Candidatus Peribacteria bacterium RIFOXYC1_FULL_58_8]ALM11085.1 MAG: hypothetical protein PeribacterB2_0610 [Candidatus Peribacter riflensis]ALM12188.1 MAG: hypothetical protein PeribacterC2_0610 [Candidatus Peribacter riflensis]